MRPTNPVDPFDALPVKMPLRSYEIYQRINQMQIIPMGESGVEAYHTYNAQSSITDDFPRRHHQMRVGKQQWPLEYSNA
jgi:hypothetical protein